MKKNLILMMLLLTGAVSVHAQEKSTGPTMVVTGQMVNIGTINSSIPIDLRAKSEETSTINNKEDGYIETPFLYVDVNTLFNNEGETCVGCTPPPAPSCGNVPIETGFDHMRIIFHIPSGETRAYYYDEGYWTAGGSVMYPRTVYTWIDYSWKNKDEGKGAADPANYTIIDQCF